ncbi:uncharacterized, partial [Tachysurus ichikawai]
ETKELALMGEDLAERMYNQETVLLQLMGDDQVEQMTIPEMKVLVLVLMGVDPADLRIQAS